MVKSKYIILVGMIALLAMLPFGFGPLLLKGKVVLRDVIGKNVTIILGAIKNKYKIGCVQGGVSWWDLLKYDRIKEISVMKSNVQHAKEPFRDCVIARVAIKNAYGELHRRIFVRDKAGSPHTLLSEIISAD